MRTSFSLLIVLSMQPFVAAGRLPPERGDEDDYWVDHSVIVCGGLLAMD